MQRTIAIAATLILTLTAAACGGDDGDGSAGDERSVTLVTHDSFFLPEDVLDDFHAETGIEVVLMPAGDAGSALNQMILTKDDPIGDVFFGVDTTFLSRALDEGIFVEHVSPALDGVPDDLVVDPRVTPIDYGDVCINVDRDAFEDGEAPVTLEDLADPRFAGMLVVSNPATSSPGLAFLLATIAEMGDGWEDYWAALRDNDVAVVSGWEEAYFGEFSGGGEGGTRPLVVSYASSPPATVDPDDEPLPDEAPIGTLLETCFRQVEYAGVLDGARDPDAARELVDFLLSPTVQEALPESMFVFPVVEGTPLPELFERYADVPDEALTMDPDEIAAQRETWIERWTDVVVR